MWAVCLVDTGSGCIEIDWRCVCPLLCVDCGELSGVDSVGGRES